MIEKDDKSKIIIKRESQYVNCLRKYSIYIDGKLVGKIKNGECMDFDVEPGSHIVYARLDWSRSKKIVIELNAGERIEFSCGSINGFVHVLIVMICALLSIYLYRSYIWNISNTDFHKYIGWMIFPVLIFIYTLIPSTFVYLSEKAIERV
jgi:hypothetical protein